MLWQASGAEAVVSWRGQVATGMADTSALPELHPMMDGLCTAAKQVHKALMSGTQDAATAMHVPTRAVEADGDSVHSRWARMRCPAFLGAQADHAANQHTQTAQPRKPHLLELPPNLLPATHWEQGAAHQTEPAGHGPRSARHVQLAH